MQEQEQRQRELREKLANAQIQNARAMQDPDAIFGELPDFVETRRPITRMFFAVYDNLGTLMAVNFFTFLCSLPLIYVLVSLYVAARGHKATVVFVPLLLVGLFAPPAWAAASSYCAKIVEDQMHPLGDYWSDYRRYAIKSLLLTAVQWVVGGILLYATGWYITQPGGAFKIIGIISLYIFVFWALAGLYMWPLMVRGYSWRSILRNAGVLVIAGPLRSVLIMLLLLISTVLLTFTGIGLAALVFALWAMLPNQALVLTRERLERRASAKQSAG